MPKTCTRIILDHHQLVELSNFPYVSISSLARLSDSKQPKDDALRQLRAEMQRCLGCLKGKRQKVSQLQEELQLCQGRVSELQGQLDEAKLSNQVRTSPDAVLNTELVRILR